MNNKKRILVLYADAGFGHRTAANAIAEALIEMHGDECQVELFNPLDDRRTPVMLRDSQTDHDYFVRKLPELYNLGYEASDATLTSTLMESGLILLLYEVMRDVIRRYQPDAIVTTYPLYPAPLDAVFTLSRFKIPLITVVTDMGQVHRLWFNSATDHCLVPNSQVRALALESGLHPRQVHVTGIPVSPRITCERRSSVEIRRSLGWDEDLVTILAVGGKRVDGMQAALNVINHSGFPLQLAVVAGGDEALYEQLQSTTWHLPVSLYNYVQNMHEMICACDIVLGKAGGLIVTESLACGRPMLVINAIAGQEKGNAEFVTDMRAGALTEDPITLLETISHWLANGGEILAERSGAARGLGRPRAAYEAAEYAFAEAQIGPHRKIRPSISTRQRLMGLLSTNKIKY